MVIKLDQEAEFKHRDAQSGMWNIGVFNPMTWAGISTT